MEKAICGNCIHRVPYDDGMIQGFFCSAGNKSGFVFESDEACSHYTERTYGENHYSNMDVISYVTGNFLNSIFQKIKSHKRIFIVWLVLISILGVGSLFEQQLTDFINKIIIQQYESLNLSIKYRTQTFYVGDDYSNSYIISQDENLVGITPEGDSNVIDNDVMSISINSTDTFYYIKNDNSLWGWGDNTDGCLGDGTGVNQDKPVKILDDVVWIERNGNINNYAIKKDKTCWKWGYNSAGNDYVPIKIADNVVKTIGDSMYLSSDGIVYEFASNSTVINEPVYDFQRFDSDSSVYIDSNNNLKLVRFNYKSEYETSIISDNVKKVVVMKRDTWGNYSDGGTSSLHFIKQDNTLWGYGLNSDGQLGDGTKIPEYEVPVKISDDVKEVYEWEYITLTDELWIWGSEKPTPFKLLQNISSIGRAIPYQEYNYIVSTDKRVFYTFNNWTVLSNEYENVEDAIEEEISTYQKVKKETQFEVLIYGELTKVKLPSDVDFE